MSVALSRCLCRVLSRQTTPSSILSGEHHAVSPWFAPVMTLKTSAPLRAEPKKKKKVDPRREQLIKDRLRKKLRKLEKIPPEFIPIEDFITPAKCNEVARERSTPKLSPEETEARAMLLREWSQYKQAQHFAEVQAVELALKAQREALKELKLESPRLYEAAIKADHLLFPLVHEGPAHTPPKTKYEAPEGKYNDITKIYTQ